MSTSPARLSGKQKTYLSDKLSEGQRTGLKHDPQRVSEDMRTARNQDGHQEFHEFLNSHQIAGFCSRISTKNRKTLPHVNDTVLTVGGEAASIEIHQISHELADVLSIRHPVLFNSKNLCALQDKEKLKSLPLAEMKAIITEFELTEQVGGRKAPYFAEISRFLSTCSCHDESA